MKVTLSILLGFPIIWLFAALFYVTDPDINGIHSLSSAQNLVAVTLIALIMSVPGFMPLIVYNGLGLLGYWGGLLSVSFAMGIYTAFVSNPTIGLLERLYICATVTMVWAVVFFLTTLPGLLALRSHQRKQRSRF